MSATLPLPGPLHQDPTSDLRRMTAHRTPATGSLAATHVLAEEMLATALVGVDLGTYDRRIIVWLSGWEASTVATVASLLRRSFEAGLVAGRTEAHEEGSR